MTVTEPSLASIIYDWLVSPDMTPKSQTSRFLDRIGAFSMQGLGEVLPENKAHSPALGDTGFIAYYNNEGKRQAVRDLTAFILALDAPCLIRVFTDESLDWVYEDSAFTRELAGYVGQVVQKGCRIQRVRAARSKHRECFRSMDAGFRLYGGGS